MTNCNAPAKTLTRDRFMDICRRIEAGEDVQELQDHGEIATLVKRRLDAGRVYREAEQAWAQALGRALAEDASLAAAMDALDEARAAEGREMMGLMEALMDHMRTEADS